MSVRYSNEDLSVDRAKAVLEHTRRANSRAADLAPVLEQLRSEGAGSLGALAAAQNAAWCSATCPHGAGGPRPVGRFLVAQRPISPASSSATAAKGVVLGGWRGGLAPTGSSTASWG